MGNLSEVWSEVEKYLLDNLSIIPIRDKDDEDGVAKSPFGKWTFNQTNRIDREQLWAKMEKFDTTAVGIVCGKVSGNLEVIDIDSKYMPGIDATLFKDLESFYPSIWAVLRIHKTPSGGYHLLYRVHNHDVDGNQKLAGRIPTDFEIMEFKRLNPMTKKSLSSINFLETRGEKGYIAAPPSLNYSVFTDVPIPVLTWEERCSIIELCKTYNQIIKVDPPPRQTKHDDSVYDVNPFIDFNNRCDPTDLVERNGWKREKENNHFIWYTRPGKSKGVSLSWNKEKLIFYSFSASTDLEPERGYHASTFLTIYQFGGDGKKTYAWLVQNGYGKIKPSVEKSILQRAKISNKSVPANLSADGLKALEEQREEFKEAHPYGVFWEYDDEGKLKISRERLYSVSHELGFRLYNDEPVQIIGQFIHLSEKGKYYDCIKKYIREDDEDERIKICNVLEAFLQVSGQYTISRLRALDLAYVLKDTFSNCYKFYENKVLDITENEIQYLDYTDIDMMLVWHHKILKRNIEPIQDWPRDHKYYDFLSRAIGITDYLKKIIGYLAHDFKDENTGYIVTLTETCPDPKGGGGSGKNVFGNLLRNITTVCTVAGSQVQFNEKFLQAWNEERVFFMADIPKKFDFEYLKEMSTGYGTLKKLFKDEKTIPPSDMPKLLANTNFSFDASDGGLKRRILPIEFTNFFTAQGGIDAYYGCMFPSGWSEQDWHGYDWFMVECLQAFLKCKGKITPAELSDTGWEKQFKHKYQELTWLFITDNFDDWISMGKISNDSFKGLYDVFCSQNNINKSYQLSSQLMNKAIAAYCEKHNVTFLYDKQMKEGGVNVKYRIFQSIGNEKGNESNENL